MRLYNESIELYNMVFLSLLLTFVFLCRCSLEHLVQGVLPAKLRTSRFQMFGSSVKSAADLAHDLARVRSTVPPRCLLQWAAFFGDCAHDVAPVHFVTYRTPHT